MMTSSEREKLAAEVAHQVYDAFGFRPEPERLSNSFLGLARQTGMLPPIQNQHPSWMSRVFGNAGAPSPLPGTTDRYHFEEALVVRFWAMEAEGRFGFVTRLITLCERELRRPLSMSGVDAMDVLRQMTRMILFRAMQRAKSAGAPGTLTEDEALEIFNARVDRYEALVIAAVNCKDPIPKTAFRIGVEPRDHPLLELFGYCADNLVEALGWLNVGLEATAMQMAVQLRWNANQSSFLSNGLA